MLSLLSLLPPLLQLLSPAQTLSTKEAAALRAIDAAAPQSVALLERIVNQNSGTFHIAGVDAVAAMLEPEFQALGFTVRRLPMDAVKRAGHLVAERKGTRGGKPLLLIGHMDTVFEPSSPFQKFVRNGSSATGPGVADMKGGLVVMLAALKGLQQAGLLADAAPIQVFLTADEEAPGDPIATTRGAFIEAGKQARAALCFETGVRRDGRDYASTARRGFTGWKLIVKGTAGHSSQIFTERMGHGAAFELSRILTAFHDQLPEPNLTFNVGLMLGGAGIQVDTAGDGRVNGKDNIIPAEAQARGELRALSPEQVSRVKDKMYAITAKNLPGTSAELTFDSGYPPMAPTAGNKRLLAALNDASRLAGLPELGELDPMQRGAGDISFLAPHVDSLSGLGAIGTGSHAVGESVDLDSLARQAKRAALLIHKLTH
jgi:glutamate carboxypeptidase